MTDDLIEAVARAICAGIGLRSWDDVPADRGDLRNRIRNGDGYDVNEPTRMDYRDGAQDAIRAAAPLILDMAADEAEKNIHNFFNRADTVEAFARHRKYGYDQGYYDGRQLDRLEERAAIVAWLRTQDDTNEKWALQNSHWYASEIEAGGHLK